jgi:methionine synthase II (cobalamin-independent)
MAVPATAGSLIPIVDDPLFKGVSGFEFLDADSGWRDLWKTGAGEPADTSGLPPEEPFVTRRLEVDRDIVTDEFAFLKANAHARAKYTIPAPSWHRIYWHPEYSTDAYPTSDDFIADVTRILREHVIDRLVALGCDYIQIDAPNYAQWHIDRRTGRRSRRTGTTWRTSWWRTPSSTAWSSRASPA